ncbi:MAG: hypothetical protein H6Q04_170, partial [Acidobacteria bacterium]|nr:hypothetical protein [Acidobacteriota bacterium]
KPIIIENTAETGIDWDVPGEGKIEFEGETRGGPSGAPSGFTLEFYFSLARNIPIYTCFSSIFYYNRL